MEPIISIQDLKVNFKTDDGIYEAVKGISFDLMPNETIAIVGESGSGKSVTSLAIMGLLATNAQCKGQIIFNGKNLVQEALQTRGKDIAMIFQEPMTSLNPLITCGQQVVETLLQHKKIDKKRAEEETLQLFEKVKLPHPQQVFKKYPHEISGGQKQRVMIAIAICCNPKILIADEPTTALDVTVQKNILQLIKELQTENNMSVIFITHDLGVVAEIADKVLVMYRGEQKEYGPAQQVLFQPQNSYTKALLATRPAQHPKGYVLPTVDEILNQKNTTPQKNPEVIIEDEVLLEVKNLCVHYKPKANFWGKKTEPYKAVDDVSFTLKKGQILGLVGESGCGKTTLGRTILQLIPATSGSIILNGKSILDLPKSISKEQRKDFQIIFQDPYGSLNPRIAIGDAILEAMNVHQLHNKKDRKNKVLELLEKVNLNPDFFNRFPHEFSGGQRQRICIARALALEPKLLIFDESVSALDVSVQAQVLNLINELKAEFNFSALFISHDLSVVHYIADEILVMYKGKIVEHGSASDIYFNPKQEYTQKLIDAIPGKNLKIG